MEHAMLSPSVLRREDAVHVISHELLYLENEIERISDELRLGDLAPLRWMVMYKAYYSLYTSLRELERDALQSDNQTDPKSTT